MRRRISSVMFSLVPRRHSVGALAVLIASTACSSTDSSSPGLRPTLAQDISEAKVALCHVRGAGGGDEIGVAGPAMRAHIAHGDYVTRLVVDPAGPTDDGVHFRRVTDALAAVHDGRISRGELQEGACRITVVVAAGTFRGTLGQPNATNPEQFPLVIDVPDVTLEGAFTMQVDGDGRATGISEGGAATTFTPSPALGGGGATGASENILIINGHPGGSAGHRAIVDGFVFQSGRAPGEMTTGGIALLTMRVSDVVVRDSRFETNLASAVDMRASSGEVDRIHFSGLGSSCDVCLAGPGSYVFRNSRLIGGGTPGVLIFPAVQLAVPSVVEQFVLPVSSHVDALVINNEVRNHLRRPVGVGLRVGAVGVGAFNVAGSVKATFEGNTLINNMFGMLVEASFVRDGSVRRGDIDLTTRTNVITGSCQNDLLVAFTPSQTAVGSSVTVPVLSSTYKLTLGDVSWDASWYWHPAGTGNTLIVNGETIPYGSRVAYDAAKVCP